MRKRQGPMMAPQPHDCSNSGTTDRDREAWRSRLVGQNQESSWGGGMLDWKCLLDIQVGDVMKSEWLDIWVWSLE